MYVVRVRILRYTIVGKWGGLDAKIDECEIILLVLFVHDREENTAPACK